MTGGVDAHFYVNLIEGFPEMNWVAAGGISYGSR